MTGGLTPAAPRTPVVILDREYQECDQCIAPAEWRYEHPCGQTALACGRHRKEHADRIARGNVHAKCRRCRQSFPNRIPWEPIVRTFRAARWDV